MSSDALTIRLATPADAGRLAEFAARTFEETFALFNRPEDMALHRVRTYGHVLQLAEINDPDGRSLLAEVDGRAVGFALFFHNYSTFLTRPGIYLEDLFVLPEERGRGYGKALLTALGRLAVERGCGRLEWSVLDWNEPSIKFYRSLGAVGQDEWTINRVTGDALKKLASMAPPVVRV